jgi:NAD-dependent dihydropyrimidine dehydrogenase PreA subunit
MREQTNQCKYDPGQFKPVIDRNRCEGKNACVAVCPYGVFSPGTLAKDQRGGLTLVGKIKGFAHGWQQAFVVNPQSCRGCGLCVDACPESAITLTSV